MRLSKRLRKWKANLTTQTPVEYVITLREDVNSFADEVRSLERENAKLRELARKTWHIAMSERCTLDDVRAYDNMSMDPEEYVKAIDAEIDKIRVRMQGLGIEV